VLATLLRIGLIMVVVIVAVQVIQRGATGYIGATDAHGNLLYSNRTRTLASMARNLAVTLLVAIGMIEVLSELGVNANALLAGAGVVGLAIGFGAQTLVKDLITGMFILIGDTVRVGDVVDLGGRAGVVEAISMRTITLRAYNGDVHTIPYSSIDVVTNMTKDFSYYVFDLVVAYKEDVDRVVEVLLEIDSQLRREWPYRRLMLEPLEIAGVDAFRESGPVIRARTKVRPGEQWKVGREFNRRIKRRFDELGIELPVPQQKVVFSGGAAEDAAAVLLPEPVRRAAGQA
jgi:small conductance mechanosensitive channel